MRTRKGKKSVAADTGLTEQLKTRLFDLRKAGLQSVVSDPGRCLSFPRQNHCWTLISTSRCSFWWTGSRFRRRARSRIVDAVETAYRESGEVIFDLPARGEQPPRRLRFSHRFECKHCNLRYEEPEPRLFSFNNPYGACPRCQGFGNTIDFDLDLVIPDKTKSLGEGAVDPWNKPKYRPLFTEMKRFAKQSGIPLDVPWGELEAGTAGTYSEWGGRLFGGARILPVSGAEEVQAARSSFSEPLSRVFDLSGMPWKPAAAGGAPGQNQRAQHL